MTTATHEKALVHTRLSTRTVGLVGLGWALSYVPIHLYWALGGTSTPIGITGELSGFRVANWGACVVIAGAGLTCLSLTRPWGDRLPGRLRRGTAWVGGLFGLAHWLSFTAFAALRVSGLMGYPADAGATESQLRRFDWANLGYFELWFGVMGALLIACSLRSRAADRQRPQSPMSLRRRIGLTLSLAGIAIVLWGVFTFQPWTFAGVGPAVTAIGLAMSLATERSGSDR